MLVEKIDLKSLFGPVCWDYHIPIATSKGWSSMLQRAEYARRFKQAENMGLKCVTGYEIWLITIAVLQNKGSNTTMYADGVILHIGEDDRLLWAFRQATSEWY